MINEKTRRFETTRATGEAVVLKKYVMYKPIDFYPRWYLEVIADHVQACFYDFEVAEQFLREEGYTRAIWFVGDFAAKDGTFIAWFFDLAW